jgi:hypothetical protein
MFVQDLFAEAKRLGLTDGFVGSYADLKELVNEATAPFQPDEDGDLAYQRHLENQGWYAAQAQEAYEASFGFPALDGGEAYDGEPVKPVFTAENDPDGEAENAWHEQQGERWAESRASAWFAFPGDRR